ncbi:TPA: ornithine carbamoyltransferase [Candidatus Bathyarchaeota archaeon]|nr:ornithine carbamoyltransferase [Candidatus Bathyarchaeota archaeon]
MKGGLKGRDLLTLQELSPKEIWDILNLSRRLKEEGQEKPLKGKVLAMIFQKPSTRTRVSFEVAMRQLGGEAIYLGWRELQLGRGETIADTAKVLSRYVDGIMARVYAQSTLEELARNASVPVINGLSDLCHPVQILADLFTMWEKKGEIKGLKVAYVGDGNNVCNSLLIGCSKMGIDLSVACPKGYEPDGRFVKWALENAKASGSEIKVGREPLDAVKNADFIYTDVIASMGQESEREVRLKLFLPKYQITNELFKLASKEAYFMHPLPCHRGEEVTSAVVDGPRSIVWDQAENRLHTTKALLSLIF